MQESNNNQAKGQKMTTTQEIQNAIEGMKNQHNANWLEWNARLEKLAKTLGVSSEDELEDVTAAEIQAAGFTPAESDALVFVLTQEVMGRPVNNIEMIERWFSYAA